MDEVPVAPLGRTTNKGVCARRQVVMWLKGQRTEPVKASQSSSPLTAWIDVLLNKKLVLASQQDV